MSQLLTHTDLASCIILSLVIVWLVAFAIERPRQSTPAKKKEEEDMISEDNSLPDGHLRIRFVHVAENEKILALVRYLIDNEFLDREEVLDGFGKWNAVAQANRILKQQ